LAQVLKFATFFEMIQQALKAMMKMSKVNSQPPMAMHSKRGVLSQHREVEIPMIPIIQIIAIRCI